MWEAPWSVERRLRERKGVWGQRRVSGPFGAQAATNIADKTLKTIKPTIFLDGKIYL
jgi:hypothetical protein